MRRSSSSPDANFNLAAVFSFPGLAVSNCFFNAANSASFSLIAAPSFSALRSYPAFLLSNSSLVYCSDRNLAASAIFLGTFLKISSATTLVLDSALFGSSTFFVETESVLAMSSLTLALCSVDAD